MMEDVPVVPKMVYKLTDRDEASASQKQAVYPFYRLVVCFALLNVAGINAQVLYTRIIETESHMRRRHFMKSLAMDLVKERVNVQLAVMLRRICR
jgi:hypothetical protein